MLSVSILAPLVGSLLIGLVSNSNLDKNKPKIILFAIALIASLISLIASLKVAYQFDVNSIAFQMQETWFFQKGGWFQWSYAVDNLNLSLYLLTTLLFPIGICFSYSSFMMSSGKSEIPKEKLFWMSLLILESSVIGVFLASNLIAFYVFWELMLIPMLLLIGIWGGENRKYAAIKFFIYTFAGSVFLILGIIALGIYTSASETAFDIAQIMNYDLAQIDIRVRRLIFWAFLLSFLIKIPAFPFHTWLPHAHTEAPTVGSIILAGVLLKMGAYGIFRFSLDLFPRVSHEFSFFFLSIGVIGIVYGAWLAWAQTDIKKMIAYSSVSHMGYILAGAFSENHEGVSGAYLQIINHGISTGLLFLLVGMIYDRTHTRKLEDYQGLAKLSPLFAFFFMIAILSSIGLPGTNGFVGEFLVLMGIYLKSPILAGIAVTGVIFGAVYMLHLYKQVFWGEPSEKLLEFAKKNILQLKLREILMILPFIVMIFWLGVKPSLVLHSTKKGIDRLVLKTSSETQKGSSIKLNDASNNQTEIHQKLTSSHEINIKKIKKIKPPLKKQHL